MRDREDTARSCGDSDVRRRDDRDDRRRERERLPGRLRSQGVCTCLFPDWSYASSKLQSAPVGKLPDEENATLGGMEDDRFPGRLKEGSVFSTTSPLMPVLLLKTYLGLLGTVDFGPTGLAPLERNLRKPAGVRRHGLPSLLRPEQMGTATLALTPVFVVTGPN